MVFVYNYDLIKMNLDRTLKYMIGYATVSSILLAWSVYDCLGLSSDLFTFLIEFTNGYRLGIVINSILMFFLLTGKILQLSLFGELRIIETEHILEKLPIFFVNLLFNLSSNDNNLLLNCFLVGISVGFKIFNIILMDRMDFVHMKIQNAVISDNITSSETLRKYLLNMNFWLVFFFTTMNFAIAKFLVYDVFQGINSVTCLLFGFQFAVQGVDALTYFSKLSLNIYELVIYRSGSGALDDDIDYEDEEQVWENKGIFMKTIDIGSAILKSVSYLGFIYLLTFHSGLSLPISMMQGTYMSLKQTYKEVKQLLSFVESSKKLDSQLPNATDNDLGDSDNLCIVCREDMHSVEEYERVHNRKLSARRYPKKLRCGHILHMGCLKDWLERSELCPLCRRKVFLSDQSTPESTNSNMHERFDEDDTTNNNMERQDFQRQNNRDIDTTETNGADYFSSVRDVNETDHPTLNRFGNEQSLSRIFHEGTYQQIRLPRNALLPPDWTILPLTKNEDNSYELQLSTYDRASFRKESKNSRHELNIIEPNGQNLRLHN